jgi:small GTP-binding protein
MSIPVQSVTTFDPDAFRGAAAIEIITFAPGSNLRELQEGAFSRFSSLKSVCISASVEVIGRYCFSGNCFSRSPLETATFEAGSRLREVKSKAFWGGWSMKSLSVPRSVEIWDTAGQEGYRSLGPLYYRLAIGALVVFDLTNPRSYEHLTEWISAFKAEAGNEAVIAISGNKADMLANDEEVTAKAESFAVNANYIFEQFVRNICLHGPRD